MKKNKKLYGLAFCLLFFASCGYNTDERAESLCGCMKDVGLNQSVRMSDLSDRQFQRDISHKAEQILPKCIGSVMEDIEKDISDLSKNDKKEYTRQLLKDIVDTECSDIVLDHVPFDLLGIYVDALEKESERNARRDFENLF